ncbi:MAG TPA: 2-oxoglutarate dehydrogenase, E2 component, dihydrolipoamide succinyltransferase [Mycobacteriales bacterium]
MAVSVTMPRLGESVSEGTVTRWLKHEGDHVEADEPLLEVSTDKVDTEIPSPASGTLTRIVVQEDETVDVGVELATIGDAGEGDGGGAAAGQGEAPAESQEAAPAAAEPAQPPTAAEPVAQPVAQPAAAEEPAPEPPPAPQEPAAAAAPEPEPTPEREAAAPPAPAAQAAPPQAAAPPAAASSGAPGGGESYVTPLVRKLAGEHGVDLAAVSGTGIGGRIRKQDVLDAAGPAGRAASAPAPAAAGGRHAAPATPTPTQAAQAAAATQVRGKTEKLSRLREVIATRMVESLQVSAQLTTVVEADVTGIAKLRATAQDDFEAREGVRLSFLPFFALATVEALKVHPKLNATIDLEAKTVTYHEAEHLGVAVDTDRGLLVPVIHNAGDLNIGGLARKIADLAERTRSNNVSPDELGGGTFTLTNTGSRGALIDTPIINQPQTGVLGTGSVVKRAVVVDDPELGEVIAVRSMVFLSLTYDHRLVDGADAARFLATVKDRLEAADFAADLGL